MPEQSTHIRLKPGESAVFGYGSLMLRESMERSLGRAYHGPFVDCELEGWRRAWDVAMPNRAIVAERNRERFTPEHILYLNVRPDAATTINGTLFVVTQAELIAFDTREWIYRRVQVTTTLRGVSIDGGDAYIYVGLPEHEWRAQATPREAAVRASYLRVIDEALRRRAPGFREAYERSTDAPPPALIVSEVETTIPAMTPRIKLSSG